MRRQKVIDTFLNTLGDKKPLCIRLQREIDFVRQHAGGHHEALQKIAKMMYQQLDFLAEQMEHLGDEMSAAQALQP